MSKNVSRIAVIYIEDTESIFSKEKKKTLWKLSRLALWKKIVNLSINDII